MNPINWDGNILDIGPLYPFVGTEVLMVVVLVALWVAWQLSTMVGLFLGQQLPESLPLDFALPLTFIAIVVPLVRDRATVADAVVAGVVIVLVFDAPLKLGLLIAALAGMVAGLALDRSGEQW